MSRSFNARGKSDRERKRDGVLPDPPDYARWKLRIPPFFASYHPYTKWMLNMIRGNAIHRLATMIKERPVIFRHYFQIADAPETQTNDNRDHICMFHRRCVLYLTPLCLAVYLKRDKVVDLLIKSRLNNPYQSCFATEVFTTKPADILEICAACVALKREFFQVLPLLCQFETDYEDNPDEIVSLKLDEPITLRYVTTDAKRCFHYQDLLHYGIDLLQRNANYPLNRLVECLVINCAEFYDANKMHEDSKGEKISLIRRLSRFAFYEDDQCRISLPVIACFEILLRNFCVPWKPRPIGKSCIEDPDFILKHLQTRNFLALDQDASLLLLCGLYHQLRTKSRGLSRLNALGHVIHRLLAQMQWLPVFFSVNLEDLQLISKDINECIPITKQTLVALQHHVSAIDEMEKNREIVINNDLRSRRERTKSFRKSCAHSAMPHPLLVGGFDATAQTMGKEQMMAIQQMTRTRKPQPVVQLRDGPTVSKYRHGAEQVEPPSTVPAPPPPLPPPPLPQATPTPRHSSLSGFRRRHERGTSDPSLRSSYRSGLSDDSTFEGPLRRPPSTGSQFQDKRFFYEERCHPIVRGGLGDQEDDYDDLEITSVTEWTDFDSIMTKSPSMSKSNAQGEAKFRPLNSRTTSYQTQATQQQGRRHHRRSNSWDGREVPNLSFGGVSRHWRDLSPPRGGRRNMHHSTIDAYEKYVLGVMYDDYDCDTSQGDFGPTPPRPYRKPRAWNQRVLR